MTNDLLGGRRWRVVQGDVMEVLGGMPDNSVHCIITSPPYWGLRDYGIPPTIWDGEEDCEHEWGAKRVVRRGHSGDKTTLVGTQTAQLSKAAGNQGSFCRLCGAWRGTFGLEPTIELYCRHLVTVFRELRRVLREDAVCFLNIGDSYWGGKGQSGQAASEYQAERVARGASFSQPAAHVGGRGKTRPSDGKHPILKPKDLCLIPARVALALQQPWRQCLTCEQEFHTIDWGIVRDRRGVRHFVCPECMGVRVHRITELGWWVRQRIIWAKGVSFCETYSGSSMPESVTDRPSTSHEDVYLLSKAKSYFYDNEAVKEDSLYPDDNRKGRAKEGQKRFPTESVAGIRSGDATYPKRNLRSVWLINPHPFKDAHFATFPPALVEPMIKAGTSEKGVCPECGAPWRRVVEKTGILYDGQRSDTTVYTGKAYTGRPQSMVRGPARNLPQPVSRTLGWEPTCDCHEDAFLPHPLPTSPPDWFTDNPGAAPVPAIVLDPFSGSGTTIMVALRLGRRGIGIDISEEYCAMSRKRIIEDCPMWNAP